MRSISFTVASTLLLSLASGYAHAFELGIPLECNYGKDCFIQNYFDNDTTKNWADYQCGSLSYDDHHGTDFRLRDYVAMEKGVNVIAAENGTVKAVRDGMDDVNVKVIGRDAIRNKECGNGVVVTYDETYEVQYCHLKKGSIIVKPGDVITKGQKLGLVGLSGMTEFPHVDISIRKNTVPVDPFINAKPWDAAQQAAADAAKPLTVKIPAAITEGKESTTAMPPAPLAPGEAPPPPVPPAGEVPVPTVAQKSPTEAATPSTGTLDIAKILTPVCPHPAPNPLWDKETREKLVYIPSAVLNAAFSSTLPEAEAARAGKFRETSITRETESLIFWTDVMGVRKGDELYAAILLPDGTPLVEHTDHFDSDKVQYFKYIGKKARNGFWVAGTYTGKVVVRHNGAEVASETVNLEVK